MRTRHGIGYDIHRLVPTVERESLLIGGVSIPCYFKVTALSDGDVLLHALIDACLGALALGDIGTRFSEQVRHRPSSEFVVELMSEIRERGWQVEQIDSIVLVEEPKLRPHAEIVRASVAKLFGLPLETASVKAKSMEGLDSIGERRAIAAHAVVTLAEI